MSRRPAETLVQLHHLGLQLWQRRDFFGFTEDSQTLAEFVGQKPECRRICELGSGSGGLLMLVWANNQQAQCYGLEIMSQNVRLAKSSIELNAAVPGLAQGCHFQQGDWRTPELYFEPQSFDLLISNPPYRPPGQGRLSPVLERAAARNEIFGGLAELLASAAWLLRPQGKLALVLPRAREAELRRLLAKNGFCIQRETTHKQLLLIEAQKE